MKLLLTSTGLTNETIINALKDLCGRPLNELNLAFIPTAMNAARGDKKWFIKNLNECMTLPFASYDIVEIAALPKAIWLPRLEKADVIAVSGGNTHYLAYWMRKSGLAKLLPDFLQTKIYVGISAGSIVASKDLKMSSSKREDLNKVGETSDTGLGLVHFHVRPHLGRVNKFPKSSTEYLMEAAKEMNETIYGIDDSTAIKIDGDKVEVVSEGTWQKFN